MRVNFCNFGSNSQDEIDNSIFLTKRLNNVINVFQHFGYILYSLFY